MTARIFKPAKNAMQSGRAETREWQLDYEPEQPRAIEPLMGWTSSGDMKQQITLHFDTKEEAVAYCERKGTSYQVIEPKDSAHRRSPMPTISRSGAANPGPLEGAQEPGPRTWLAKNLARPRTWLAQEPGRRTGPTGRTGPRVHISAEPADRK